MFLNSFCTAFRLACIASSFVQALLCSFDIAIFHPRTHLRRTGTINPVSTMLYKALLTAALLAGPAAARGRLGFAVGNTTPDNKCKTSSDYANDFDAIKKNTEATLIRTYSNTDQFGNVCHTAAEILPAAQDAGLKVLLGMWPDGGAYDREKKALVDADLSSYSDTVFGISVGSEGIYRGTYSEEELLAWLADMEKTFPGTLIGTADSWNGWANGSMDGIINSGVKLILANAFPYWQYQDIGNATKTYFDTMGQALGHIQKIRGDNEFTFMNGGRKPLLDLSQFTNL